MWLLQIGVSKLTDMFLSRKYLAITWYWFDNQEINSDFRYVDDGCHSVSDDIHGSFKPKSFRTGVRCCSVDGKTCQTPGQCPGNFSYFEAESLCNLSGHRICTKDELHSGVCCGTGGTCDNNAVWSSTNQTGIFRIYHYVTFDFLMIIFKLYTHKALI